MKKCMINNKNNNIPIRLYNPSRKCTDIQKNKIVILNMSESILLANRNKFLLIKDNKN